MLVNIGTLRLGKNKIIFKMAYSDTTVIIPTYNEAKNIKKLVEELLGLGENIQIVIVDDNSQDGTAEISDELSKKYKDKVFILHREGKLGLGSAYIAGFKYAIERLDSDLIFSMDADFSHDPKYLSSFVRKVSEGYDVVLGSRYIEGGGVDWIWYRRFLSKGANSLAKTLLGLDAHDLTTGYRCYKKHVLKSIDLDNIRSDGFSFLEEVLYLSKQKGFKIGEVPIFFVDRQQGKSKLSKKEMIKFFITIIRLKLGSIIRKQSK